MSEIYKFTYNKGGPKIFMRHPHTRGRWKEIPYKELLKKINTAFFFQPVPGKFYEIIDGRVIKCSPKTRHLFLTHYWFREVSMGRKNVEYREIKPTRKLNFEVGGRLIFHRGYTATNFPAIITGIKTVDFNTLPQEEKEFFAGKEKSKFLAIEFIGE